MDEYGIYPEIVVTATLDGGGGWGSWDSFDFGSGFGFSDHGFSGAGFDGMGWGGGGGEAPAGEPPQDEAPPEETEGDEVVVTAEPLPYTVEVHADGTTIARAYDFWTGTSYFVSVGPDGEAFAGSQPFDVNDFSTEPYMNYPPSQEWLSLDWA